MKKIINVKQCITNLVNNKTIEEAIVALATIAAEFGKQAKIEVSCETYGVGKVSIHYDREETMEEYYARLDNLFAKTSLERQQYERLKRRFKPDPSIKAE